MSQEGRRRARPRSSYKRTARCASCGRTRQVEARGWCGGCYTRWRRAGRPEDGPPPPRDLPVPRRDRLEDLAFLLESGVTEVPALAARMGVLEATVRGYLRELRRAGGHS